MRKILIVLPAYNASKTLLKTYNKIPEQYQKHVLLVDDKSLDDTVSLAKKLNIEVLIHDRNRGYGGNQKTCYQAAIKKKADIVVMLHPDYQYPPEMITPLINLLETNYYQCALGSRILSGEALRGNMPIYKYLANRFITFVENIFTGAKLSEYHTGLRAFRVEVLKNIAFEDNSDGYIFDNQILLQILAKGYRVGEISTPCSYFPEMSSINFVKSMGYGISCLYWGFIYFLGRIHLYRHPVVYSVYC